MKCLDNTKITQIINTFEYLRDDVAMTDIKEGIRDPDQEVELIIQFIENSPDTFDPRTTLVIGCFAGAGMTLLALILWVALS